MAIIQTKVSLEIFTKTEHDVRRDWRGEIIKESKKYTHYIMRVKRICVFGLTVLTLRFFIKFPEYKKTSDLYDWITDHNDFREPIKIEYVSQGMVERFYKAASVFDRFYVAKFVRDFMKEHPDKFYTY